MMKPRRRHPARAFTLVEVLVAAMITTFVLGAIWTSVGQMTKARAASRQRLMAYLRADTALNAIRRDIAAVIRSDDLFWTKLRITDGSASTLQGVMERDELLLFNTRLRPLRADPDYGEGIEYEVQYRIQEDERGPILWQRRDAVPDDYPDGGGIAIPLVDGVAGLRLEAYDGEVWLENWDSDQAGLPFAVRVTVMVPITDSPFDRPVVLRTVVSLDRVLPPFDTGEEEETTTTPPAGTPPTGGGGGGGGAGGGPGGAGGAGGAGGPGGAGGVGGGAGRPGGGAGGGTGRPAGGGGGGRPGGGRGGET